MGRWWMHCRRSLPALVVPLLLCGCSRTIRLFHPQGPVASAELHYTIIDVLVMSVIILPTTAALVLFIWRYRRSRGAAYDPSFNRSHLLEFLMWGVPVTTVAILGYFSFQGVFRVNPYGPTVLTGNTSLFRLPPKSGTADPVVINVVATDWQWLFIYPKQNIATLNTLVVPKNRDIAFRLTSTDVVNDFFIPQLIPMIDVMPGMRTKDEMRADHTGVWRGFSDDLSGAGFSWMQFPTRVLSKEAFGNWVRTVQGGPLRLDYIAFQKIAQPTILLRPAYAYFSSVEPHLFSRIIAAARAGKVYSTRTQLTKDMRKAVTRHATYIAGNTHP